MTEIGVGVLLLDEGRNIFRNSILYGDNGEAANGLVFAMIRIKLPQLLLLLKE